MRRRQVSREVRRHTGEEHNVHTGELGVCSGAAATGSKGLTITDPKIGSMLDPLTKVWRHPCTRPGAVTGQACGAHVVCGRESRGQRWGQLGAFLCSDPPPHTHSQPLAH